MNGHSVDGCCCYSFFLLTSVIKNLYSSVQIIFKETITQENTRRSHPILTSTARFSKAKVDLYLHSSKIFAAAKSLQSCPTLCDPIDGSPLGSPVPGILQARTLSGLPFPSPMHESEKWKWSRSVVPDSERPHGLQPTRLLWPRDFPGKSTGVGCHCLLRPRYLVDQKCLLVCIDQLGEIHVYPFSLWCYVCMYVCMYYF